MHVPKPVLGFAAFSEIEKNALLVKLLTVMKLQGLRVAVIRQSHHDFGNSENASSELTAAGAVKVLITSDTEFGALIEHLDMDSIDLIIVDGHGSLPYAKIELHRPSTGNKLIFPEDKSVIAVASDEFLETGGLPLLNINSPYEVTGYINRWLQSYPQTTQSEPVNSDS